MGKVSRDGYVKGGIVIDDEVGTSMVLGKATVTGGGARVGWGRVRGLGCCAFTIYCGVSGKVEGVDLLVAVQTRGQYRCGGLEG